jgi:hypothetical protein
MGSNPSVKNLLNGPGFSDVDVLRVSSYY